MMVKSKKYLGDYHILEHGIMWLIEVAGLIIPTFLQKAAKTIEEKLSDKLHELLIERFIDRRTTVLLKQLGKEEN